MKPRTWKTLAGGLTCIGMTMVGQALSEDGAAAAATAVGAMVGGPAGAAVGGIAVKALGGLLGDGGSELIRSQGGAAALAWLSQAKGVDGRLPLNHDLARAVRLSQLDALDFIVAQHAERRGSRRFTRQVREWTDVARREALDDDFLEKPNPTRGPDNLTAGLDGIAGRADSDTDPLAATENAMLVELREAGNARGWPIDRPEEFEKSFRGDGGHAGWLGATEAFFASRLKDEKAVALRAAFALDQARGLNQSLANLTRLLEVGSPTVAARFAAMEGELQALSLSETEAAVESRIRIVARGGSAMETLAELRRFVGTAKWARTAAAVRQRQSRLLARPVYGRETAFSSLDDFLSKRTSGLMIITGAAGAGKSSLIARWLESAALPSVAHHFISIDLPVTTDPNAIEGHIAAQLRELLGPTATLPSEGQPAGEQIYEMLDSFEASEERRSLVVVIDGLDEATARIEPFIPETLAPGLFVIATCRAESERDVPSALYPWLSYLDQFPANGSRLHINGLDQPGLLTWLQARQPELTASDHARLAKALWERMGGLPLFVSEILQTLSDDGFTGDVDSLPLTFSDYIRDRLNELDRSGDAWALAVRRLFALLSIARAPIGRWEIEEIFTVMPGTPVVELGSLDNRVARWFVVRGEGSDRQFAFHHPLLASAFSSQLEADIRVASGALAEWLKDAWRPGSRRPAAPYALDWAPRQLQMLEEGGEQVALTLLMNAEFLAARLEDHGLAQRRLRTTVEDWQSLHAVAREGAGREHATFWADHGDRLIRAWRASQPSCTTFAETVLSCLADAALIDGQTGRAIHPHPPPASDLVRSASHPGLLVAVAGHGLVMSAGRLGDVRFWDATGRQHGSRDAGLGHSGEAHLLEVLESGFVTAGEDGRVLFWTRDGQPRQKTRPDPVHLDLPLGLVPLPGGGVVTHDLEGQVIFWTSEGEQLVREQLSRPVRKVLAAHGAVFIVCDDGRGRVRSELGVHLAGTTDSDQAHSVGVTLGSATGTGFVTLGVLGGLAFWDKQGTLLIQHLADSEGGFRALLAGPLGVVALTDSSKIRFWSQEGQLIPYDGAGSVASEDRVDRVEAGDLSVLGITSSGSLLVWDWNGCLRAEHVDAGFQRDSAIYAVTGGWLVAGFFGGRSAFISNDGQLTAEMSGNPMVSACLARPSLTITGDYSGRVRFWSLDGSSLTHPDAPELHFGSSNGVSGLLQFDGTLVSYGGDGAIKFWRPEPVNGRFDLVEPNDIEGATALGAAVSGGAVTWDYYGRLLFWNAEGTFIRSVLLDEDGVVDHVRYLGDRVLVVERMGKVCLFTMQGDRILEDHSLVDLSYAMFRSVRFTGGCAVASHQAVVLFNENGEQRTTYSDYWSSECPIRDLVALEDGVMVVDVCARPVVCRFSGASAGSHEDRSRRGSCSVAKSNKRVAIGKDRGFKIWDPLDIHAGPTAQRRVPGSLLGLASLDDGFAVLEELGRVSFWNHDGQMTAQDFVGLEDKHVLWVTGKDRLYVADRGKVVAWTGRGERIFQHETGGDVVRLLPVNGGVIAVHHPAGFVWIKDNPATGEAPIWVTDAHREDAVVDQMADGRILSWSSGDIIHVWSNPNDLDDTIVVPDAINDIQCVDDGLFVFGSRLWRVRWPEKVIATSSLDPAW